MNHSIIILRLSALAILTACLGHAWAAQTPDSPESAGWQPLSVDALLSARSTWTSLMGSSPAGAPLSSTTATSKQIQSIAALPTPASSTALPVPKLGAWESAPDMNVKPVVAAVGLVAPASVTFQVTSHDISLHSALEKWL